MLIGIGASIYSGNRYDAAISSANLAARFDAALGVTASGGFASAWVDQSGNGRNLLQATGANQPIHLPFAGTKYGYLPGVAGNYFSTPDSVANSITGDIDIRVKAALADWTPAANATLIGKWGASTATESYLLRVLTSGVLLFNGITTALGSIVVSSGAVTGISDGAVKWIRFTRSSSTGFVNFYLSDDGVTWTQLGAADIATTATTLNDSAQILEIGASQAGSADTLSGKIYAAQIYNGINGTLAVDFDPSRWTSGTTFTAATGETWTINSTGSKPAQIVDRPSLLFDGVVHYMKCAAFTLNQPETVYLVAKQVSWTTNRYLFDGVNPDSMVLYQQPTTPRLIVYAGEAGPQSPDLAVGAVGVLAAVFNGAGSSLQVNGGTVATGNPLNANGGGFTLGNYSLGGYAGNLQTYEALIYNVAHDAATRSNIIRALMSKHGVTA